MRPTTAGWRPRVTDVIAAAAFEWNLGWRRRRQRGMILFGLLPVFISGLLVLLKWPGLVQALGANIVPWIAFLYVVVQLEIIALLLGTSLIAQEAEAHTLAYLLVRPLSRGSLLLGKFLGSWAVACVLLCGTLVLSTVMLLAADRFFEAALPLRALPGNLFMLCVGALSYGALFTLVGLVARRPALVGFFLAFVWENAIPFIPGSFRNLSVRHHLVSLIPDGGLPDGVRLTLDAPAAAEALAWLVGGALGWLALAMWIFSRRDYP